MAREVSTEGAVMGDCHVYSSTLASVGNDGGFVLDESLWSEIDTCSIYED